MVIYAIYLLARWRPFQHGRIHLLPPPRISALQTIIRLSLLPANKRIRAGKEDRRYYANQGTEVRSSTGNFSYTRLYTQQIGASNGSFLWTKGFLAAGYDKRLVRQPSSNY